MTALAVCPHLHRILDTPNGPTVTGVCTRCGDVREYMTAGPDEKEISKRTMRDYNPTPRSEPVAVLPPASWAGRRGGIARLQKSSPGKGPGLSVPLRVPVLAFVREHCGLSVSEIQAGMGDGYNRDSLEVTLRRLRTEGWLRSELRQVGGWRGNFWYATEGPL